MRSPNPGKAKRIERRIERSTLRANHRRLADKLRELKRQKPRAYYAWRHRRRKQRR